MAAAVAIIVIFLLSAMAVSVAAAVVEHTFVVSMKHFHGFALNH
jgi:hypothetical protein